MARQCPVCQAALAPMSVRCECGRELPEGRDTRSTPEEPHCGLCGAAMELMAQTCTGCGAQGYPALRSRQGKKSRGAGKSLDGQEI